ncbi:MAG: tetratricopeptide repeat protein [Mediterranea sp.]|jgi:tetratricopeptide (TPR) repeat protein|nr:tetratricopeptide repeat protein [Mediterranea sp.]
MDKLQKVRELIKKGQLNEALLTLANHIVSATVTGSDRSELYYLMGNAYRKMGQFDLAIHYYNLAKNENPETPAVEALKMLQRIMAFYDKNMFSH